ncbi:MAG TPA: OmpA family protein [Gemmatimonadaceae bacterium]|nr:OmpA family protein [Gemmatimonadaceae bacterium]
MRVKYLAATVTLATISASSPLAAQRWGSIEVGGFGQYTMFGDVLHLDNALGVGGMVGFFILPNVVAEGDISIARTDGPLGGKISYRPIHARVAYHVPLSQQLKLALGLGYTQGIYDGDPTPNVYEDAVGGLVGLKYYFKPSWAFNVEALFDKFPSPANQVPRDTKGYWNNSIRAGVNWIYPPLEKCALTIDPATASVTEGDSRTFTATARSERNGKVCPGTVTFASTDNAISPAGIYTPRAPGSATVTASYRGRGQRATASANVNVTARPAPAPAPAPQPAGPCVNAIDIRPDTATVLRGETVQFTASARTCAGSDTTVTVTYTGGNVDPSGRFTAGNDTGVVQITGTASVGGRSLTDVANIRVVRLRSTVVNFDLNSATLDGDARAKVDQLLASVRANARVTIRIEGHADTIPPASSRNAAASRRYNERLSLARADSVTAYLLAQGVDRSRFEPRIRGFSFCSPAVPHRAPADYQKDAQGRSLGERANRRVEIFELAMNEEEQVRWVCGGRAEPVTRATPTP